ncbi:phosphoribosyltransferase family protein [Neolewinella lacunae]|uniref:Hypoxanthine phosphoribosyltransferase n=1 Tax=Neolewinella lacunae TaxID=1517758 RepID=A0A923PME2_9BACT|nr:phosphoribosyltransferase family protein [Neolewinella lacunae]MBC6996705.1 hypoxanthine phosphoribosyltransferase [Neolewinella lacunae]MDN3633430.1 phosphoribosyltransferase family protein [Neolewinella lacunae]
MDSGKTDRIILHNLPFKPMLTEAAIQQRVGELGQTLRERLAGGQPSFVVMLKGAFVFAADLIRASRLNGEVCFVRTSSYRGTASEGKVRLHLAPDPAEITGRDLVLIEDIVDSGYTMQAFLPELERLQPRSITLVTLLHKPEAQQVPLKIDLVGFVIPPHFVVGYGLDYDGLGRHLPAIYQLDEQY